MAESDVVSELSSIAVNQLVNVKELFRTMYRAQHMGKDVSELKVRIESEIQQLTNFTMIWGYVAEREYLQNIPVDDATERGCGC